MPTIARRCPYTHQENAHATGNDAGTAESSTSPDRPPARIPLPGRFETRRVPTATHPRRAFAPPGIEPPVRDPNRRHERAAPTLPPFILHACAKRFRRADGMNSFGGISQKTRSAPRSGHGGFDGGADRDRDARERAAWQGHCFLAAHTAPLQTSSVRPRHCSSP